MIWGTAERPAIVGIGLPVYDTPEHEHTRAFRELWIPDSVASDGMHGGTYITDTRGVIIDDARNAIAERALQDPITHLLFIDSDITFPPDALHRLIRHDVGVVGGLYFNRRPPFPPLLRRANHPSWHDTEGLLGVVWDYPDNRLVPVDATGCGFLLIRREILEAVGERPFDKYPGLSEDFSFCVRVREAGIAIAVDTGLKLGHVGKLVIDEEFVKKNRDAADVVRPWRPDPKP